jgi:two-component system phosphate regulon sensor histidine kinase PhoR
VEVCQKNMRRLRLRIEELVELSDLENRRSTEPLLEVVGVGGLLDGSLETLMPRIREKELLCSLNLATDLPEVRVNAEHLERVFLNVLDNAVKFTPQGGTIRVSAEPHLHHGRRGVLVRVADTGVGIPRSECLRIFDRFHQVDHSVRRRYGGMGLGLSLVRSIVEAHRGVVWAESEAGCGATFFIWLPLRLGEDSSGSHRAISGPQPVVGAGSMAEKEPRGDDGCDREQPGNAGNGRPADGQQQASAELD